MVLGDRHRTERITLDHRHFTAGRPRRAFGVLCDTVAAQVAKAFEVG